MPVPVLLRHPQTQNRSISRNVLLLVCILLALAMLSVHSILHALQRHEPSARIFRALFEINLIVLGTACSLYLWTRAIGTKWIEQLLFFSLYPNRDNPQYKDIGIDDDDDKNYRDNDSDFAPLLFVDENTLKELPSQEDGEVLYSDEDTTDKDNALVSTSHSHVPTATNVFALFLDNLLAILVALFLFSWSASGYTSLSEWTQRIAWIAAPTFPLLLFFYAMFTLLCVSKHRSLWKVLACTIGAPLFPVTFLDGFVGDVLTSSVRPMQDITFTLVYLLYGLQGWWSQSYAAYGEKPSNNNDYSTEPSSWQDITLDSSILLPALEKSWLLHTVLLPFCVIGPLWWRFLQNLRQVMDEKKRWPYLGNAFKYFFAAQVAVTGVYYPNWHGTTVWLTAFVVATVYQIYWDIVMDWGLVERSPGGGSWTLRSERLYSSRALYWSIASINVVLRFGWTLTFLPPQYLNSAGVLIQQNKLLFMSPLLASAEIIRRTLWGWLRFEYEALKIQKEEGKRVSESDEAPLLDGLELVQMEKMDIVESTPYTVNMALNRRVHSWNDMSSLNNTQILLELCVYAVTFVTLWLVAVAHRSTQ